MTKKEFRVPVEFKSWGVVKVAAETIEEAIDKVYNGPLPTDGETEYVDDSFEIDFEGIKSFNELTDDEVDAIMTIEDDIRRSR